MTLVAGQAMWIAMVVGWYLLRRPFQRRSRRLGVAVDQLSLAERLRLTISFAGLGIVPAFFVVTGQPAFATYSPHPAALVTGAIVACVSLLLFRLTHKALGRMWSVSLQLKIGHQLVTSGIYRHLRHPMYSAFWLMALAQLLLLPNWIAGLSGLAGFGTLFFLRIQAEEDMLEEAFGQQYRDYRNTTKRVVPWIY